MPTIRIPFGTSPTSVSVTRGFVPPPQAESDSPPPIELQEPVEQPAGDEIEQKALKILALINQQLRQMREGQLREIDSIGNQLLAAATQIAKQALESEDALIEQRVTHYAEILLQQLKPKQDVTFFVHPRCVAYLRVWKSQLDDIEVDIQTDTGVEPGDCRIECNDKGLLASLDSFLHEAAKVVDLAKGGG